MNIYENKAPHVDFEKITEIQSWPTLPGVGLRAELISEEANTAQSFAGINFFLEGLSLPW